MARKVNRSCACQATLPTRAPAWPSWARVSTPLVSDHLPAMSRALPWLVTFQAKVPSPRIVRRMAVSWAGLADQLPTSLPGSTGVAPGGGPVGAGWASGVSTAPPEICLSNWADTRAWALVRTVQLTKACPDWREEARRVRAVLRSVWRASSLVECVNSVARMQQARHRKMTQGLLDLKRLYWNLRRFRIGCRKDQTPYGLLGVKVPDLSFWEFLKLTPEELRQELSALEDTP